MGVLGPTRCCVTLGVRPHERRNSVVKYPDMRGMLLDACHSVLEIRGMLPHPRGIVLATYILDIAIHALFDDCPIKELSPHDIGNIYENEDERRALLSVVAPLEVVGKAVGWTDDPRMYVAHAAWPEVECAAVFAIGTMLKFEW